MNSAGAAHHPTERGRQKEIRQGKLPVAVAREPDGSFPSASIPIGKAPGAGTGTVVRLRMSAVPAVVRGPRRVGSTDGATMGCFLALHPGLTRGWRGDAEASLVEGAHGRRKCRPHFHLEAHGRTLMA